MLRDCQHLWVYGAGSEELTVYKSLCSVEDPQFSGKSMDCGLALVHIGRKCSKNEIAGESLIIKIAGES